jgi:glycerophosphoryl diester phosphodiesterase/dienelactone hydrolase
MQIRIPIWTVLLLAPVAAFPQEIAKQQAPAAKPLRCIDAKTPEGLMKLLQYTGEPLPLVSGHRGGAAVGFPENCIATFEHTLQNTFAMLEVDPRFTKDGAIVIHHDARLERTTNGKGLVAEHTLAELKQLRLKDLAGNVTEHQISTLDEALEWARGKAILVLDQKDVPVPARVKKVEEHRAEAFAMLIVYSFAEAKACYVLNPNIMMEVMIPNVAKVAEFDKLGVPWKNVIAFVGHVVPDDPALYEAIHARGACCMIGTSRNLDKQVSGKQVGDIRELEAGYRAFLKRGADVFETDIPAQLGPMMYAKAAAPAAKKDFFQAGANSVVSELDKADSISPSPKLPETLPWKLEQLSQPPKYEWVDAKSPVRSLLYAGEPYGGKPTRVFAYYATPGTLAGDVSKDKNLPAMVLIHGGGGTAFRDWAELWAKRGYAAIAMDLAGSRPIEGKNAHQRENRERLPDGGPDQGNETKFDAIAEPVTEQWPYHAVASAIKAHSLLRSFPEVDASRTAVTGISWGGYLTCIVAGVDSRFKAAVPVYGCGFLNDNSVWLPQFARMTAEQRERWVRLWDPSRYLPAVTMPILFLNGTNDNAYPLDSYLKSFDAVPGQKQIRITINMPHGHPPGWAPQEIGLFIDQHLRGGEALPVVREPKVDDGKVRVRVDSAVKVREAALHWTAEATAINKRNWQTAAAKVDGNTIVTDAPPADSTAWFVTVTDERGAIVSSRVVFSAK